MGNFKEGQLCYTCCFFKKKYLNVLVHGQINNIWWTDGFLGRARLNGSKVINLKKEQVDCCFRWVRLDCLAKSQGEGYLGRNEPDRT